MDVADLPAMFDAIIARVTAASPPVAISMAHTFERQLKNVTLVMYAHAEGTRTPSPAGVGPPATVSGALRRSVTSWMGASGVVSTSYSGPRIFYAPIQELGHTMHARPGGWMHFWYEGEQFRKTVVIPERPYMRKALYAVIGNGSLQRNAMEVFSRIVWP